MAFFKNILGTETTSPKLPFHPLPKLPFHRREIRHGRKHLAAIMALIQQQDQLGIPTIRNGFSLEFGTPSSTHILCSDTCGLFILMTPETDGWNAEQVFLSRSSLSRKRIKEPEMRSLFKFPNHMYGDETVYMHNGAAIIWEEYVHVYSY